MQQMPRHQHRLLHGANGNTFEIGRSLGNGGMGQVYLAQRAGQHGHDPQLMAIKLLHPDAPAQARRLFYHEGALLPRLRHPHIVRYMERGRGHLSGAGTLDYLGVAYVDGETLEAALRRMHEPFPPDTVLGITAQLVSALTYLHQCNVSHCDLKPANVMLSRHTPHAVLIDFGTAHVPDFVGQPITVGTPQYMAPEQASPRGLCDGRTDIYALATIVYEMLTGKRLFANRSVNDLQHGKLVTPARNELAAALGAPVAHVLAGCLQASPDARYATASAFFADLRQAMQPLIAAPPLCAQPGY